MNSGLSVNYFTVIRFFILFNYFITGNCDGCLKPSDPLTLPTCDIIDHFYTSPVGGGPVSTYECLTGWENSIYLEKDGNVTLDCWAPFPLDMEYDGVKPIKNFQMEFYKKIQADRMDFGIRVNIVAKLMEYSGNYIFYKLGNLNDSVTIHVFAEKKDLPQFLDLSTDSNPLEAYKDPIENVLVIPCRSANYNTTALQLYFVSRKLPVEYEDLKDELENGILKYDPRRGFLRKIPTEDDDSYEIYGLYECYTEWKISGKDRIKIIAKGPKSTTEATDSDEIEEEPTTTTTTTTTTSSAQGTAPVKYLEGIIVFQPVPATSTFKGTCTVPISKLNRHTPFFGNAFMSNPTSTRFNSKCAHYDSNCGDGVRVLGNIISPGNVLEIGTIYASGIAQCVISNNMEILQYFTGADQRIYYDWQEASQAGGIVKLIPSQAYPRYTLQGQYEFKCIHTHYVTVDPIWWGLTYENGTTIESYRSGSMNQFSLSLDLKEISCGVTLWNATNWYKSSLPITVIDFAEPVIKAGNRQMTFKLDAVNQALKCELGPGPKAHLEWYREGHKVENIPIMDLGNASVLFFDKLTSDYEGNYTCRATTNAGHVDADFGIILDKNPDTPPQLVAVDDGSEAGNRPPVLNCEGNEAILVKVLASTPEHNELKSTESLSPNQILLLEFDRHPNCSNETTNNYSKPLPVAVKVVSTDGSIPIDLPPKIIEDSSEIGSSSPESKITSTTTDENMLIESTEVQARNLPDTIEEPITPASVNGDNESKTTKKAFPMYQYLLPIILGLTLFILVLIVIYGTYSYFYSPWRTRRISAVSRGPLI